MTPVVLEFIVEFIVLFIVLVTTTIAIIIVVIVVVIVVIIVRVTNHTITIVLERSSVAMVLPKLQTTLCFLRRLVGNVSRS